MPAEPAALPLLPPLEEHALEATTRLPSTTGEIRDQARAAIRNIAFEFDTLGGARHSRGNFAAPRSRTT
jgi:hypothetical protein